MKRDKLKKRTIRPVAVAPSGPDPLSTAAEKCLADTALVAAEAGARVIVVLVDNTGAFRVRSSADALTVIAALHRASIQVHLTLG